MRNTGIRTVQPDVIESISYKPAIDEVWRIKRREYFDKQFVWKGHE